MIEILKKTADLLFIYKPAGIPSQKDTSGDDDAMTLASRELVACGESGALWLVHRLDRTVGGVIVFARTKHAAAELSRMISGDEVEKSYLAVTENSVPDGILSDYLYHDKRAGRAIVTNPDKKDAKYAELSLDNLSSVSGLRLVRVKLKTGRFHQIRAQLSSRGASIVGDGKYGSPNHRTRTPALFAYKLSLTYKNQTYNITRIPDTREYPWSYFTTDLEKIQ